MRVANFRDDVLWSIVRLQGQDPKKNLDDDQAAAIVSFVNAWVRRTYDAKDYPEWTQTLPFVVGTGGLAHIVPYSSIPFPSTLENDRVMIGRVFKAYLQDPKTTPFRPLDTPHTMRPEGVHVGFEHGSLIWLKFIEQPPQFTSEVWVPTHSFSIGELTYSPISGQCYKSLANANIGNDPRTIRVLTLPTEQIQDHAPPTMAQPARNKVLELGLQGTKPGPDPPTTPLAGSVWSISIRGAGILSSSSELALVTHTATGSETLTAIAALLAAALATALPTFVSFTAGVDAFSRIIIRIEDNADFGVIASWSMPGPIGDHYTTSSELHQTVTQAYSPTIPEKGRTRQMVNVTLPDEMVMGDAVYSLRFRSPDGLEHYVEYQGLHTDGAAQIITGLADQITKSPDAWMTSVQPTADTINSVLTLSGLDEFSLEAMAAPGTIIWWKIVQFPFELLDQVVRGAYAHALKEEGQSDKGTAEEQVVPLETQISVTSNIKAGSDQMTDQVGGGS